MFWQGQGSQSAKTLRNKGVDLQSGHDRYLCRRPVCHHKDVGRSSVAEATWPAPWATALGHLDAAKELAQLLTGRALLEQRKAFIEKFGRAPGPDDPVFFDPAKDVPTPIDPARMDADLEKAMREADIDPAKAQAIRKLLR